MRMLFIYPDRNIDVPEYQGEVSISIGYLSAMLKKHKHTVGLIHIVNTITHDELIKKIRNFKPDLIGFSTISEIFPFVKTYAKWIKEELDIPIIIGGAHPSLNPDQTIAVNEIDMICVGEGEMSLLELCDKIDRCQPIDNIPSIWLKKNGKIIKNQIRPLVENLDDLPMPDRTIFNMTSMHNYMKKKYPFATIKAARGCFYSCTYCSNTKFNALYPNKKKIVRFHSVNRVIEDAKEIIKMLPGLKFFMFHDDILPANKEWFREFALKYKKEIGLPYRCKTRVELMDEEYAQLLKESNCFRIQMAVESGNQEILKLLNRPVKPEKVFRAFNICKKYGIQTHVYNMVGLPNEDARKILDTIKLNAKVKAEIIIVSIYYPYPNTELYNISKREGLIDNINSASLLGSSGLKLKDISPVKVKFFHRYFRSLVELYHAVFKLPGLISNACVAFIDFILIKFPLPYNFLIYIHDRFLKNKLLDRAYFKVEDRLFKNNKKSNKH